MMHGLQRNDWRARLRNISPFVLALTLAACGSPSGVRPMRGGDPAESEDVQVMSAPPPPNMGGGRYRLGIGDRVDVDVAFNSALSVRNVSVRPDGFISVPYVGDVKAQGLSPSELDSMITKELSVILRNPQVAVIVREFPSREVFVFGEVKSPGRVAYKETLSLTQALASAGGHALEANLSSVVVARRVSADRIRGVKVNVKEILTGERFENDILLSNNDIVYVPRSALYKVRDFVRIMYEIFNLPLQLYISGWQAANQDLIYEFLELEVARRRVSVPVPGPGG